MSASQGKGSRPHQDSSRKSLLTSAIRAFRRGVVKQNFPTSQQKSILAAPAQWRPLCSGERRCLEPTAPNNMELGFGRMAVGHFRSACEITLRRGREGEREEESGWERRISARRFNHAASGSPLHRDPAGGESAVLNTHQRRYKPAQQPVSISGNLGDWCWGQLLTRRQLCSDV